MGRLSISYNLIKEKKYLISSTIITESNRNIDRVVVTCDNLLTCLALHKTDSCIICKRQECERGIFYVKNS